jgi:crotonobetainyl-CoA:carnitine CoA-transferase CaiB-like acyl-CoA transferase
MSDLPGPLTGVRVLDLGQVYQGPYCGVLLAHAGADVIKVEAPDGDPLRHVRGKGGSPPSFYMMNTDKRTICLDLKTEAGRQVLLELVDHADILLENFAPGALDRLGVGVEALMAANPRLIHASGTGYGRSGPERDQLAMDITVQAWTGVMSVTGWPEGPPLKAGTAYIDFLSGIHLYAAIVTALYERERTGRGRVVEVAMAESAYWTLMSSLSGWFQNGEAPRMGNKQAANGLSPYDVYPCADGYVAILCVLDRHWTALCAAMGRPELGDDERYDRNGRRVAVMAEVDAIVTEWTSILPRVAVVDLAKEHGFPAAPVRTVGEVVADPHLRERGLLHEVDQPGFGPITMPRSPLLFEGTPRQPPSPARDLGADTDEVLAEVLGYDADHLAALREAGALG